MIPLVASVRRTHAALTVILLTLAALLATPSATPAAEPGGIRAGAYAMDVTPQEFPINVNGGMRDRLAYYAHDRLHARCLVLAEGETQIALVVVDSCVIPSAVIDPAKQLAEAKTDIPASNVLISATHAHSAPCVAGVFQSDPDTDYQHYLSQKIAEGIAQAQSLLEPAEVGSGVVALPNHVFNRRYVMKEGGRRTDPFGRRTESVRMNPPFASPDMVQPAGPTDPDVTVLSVRSRDGVPLALLANYSLHYVGRGIPSSALSADYFGQFAELVAPRVGGAFSKPDFVGILSNGTSGDINNINWTESARRPGTQSDIRWVALDLARAVGEVYPKIRHRADATLGVATDEITLGVRKPSPAELKEAEKTVAAARVAGKDVLTSIEEIYARESTLLAEYPDTVACPLQVLRVGDLGIVALPCEVFAEIGLEIKAKSPLPRTCTIELANAYLGYLPTVRQHENGGYETWRARSSFVEVEAAPKIVATVEELLAKVAE